MVTEGTAQKITLYNVIKHYITLYSVGGTYGLTDIQSDQVLQVHELLYATKNNI